MKEIIKYAIGMGCDKTTIEWIEKRYNNQEVSELEHIIDYIVSEKPKRIMKATYDEIKNKAMKWSESLQDKGKNIIETSDDIKEIMSWSEGFRFVKLISEKSYKREGNMMRHCVSSYFGKDDDIYSLRDLENNPHCTISKNSEQIKGKGNGRIHPKYIKYVVEFLEKLDIEVRDSEMMNLGYVNIEKIKKKLHKRNNFFRKKYWYMEDKLIDKKGNEYSELDLWDYKPLLYIDLKGNIKLNYELSKFIANLKLSGYNSNVATSGNDSKIATSGYNSKMATSGNYSNVATSGYYSNVATSGEDSKIATSGNYSNVATSGYGSKIATSGNDSNVVTGGNGSVVECSGKFGIVACMGVNSKAKGIIGTWITLAEYDENYKPLNVVSKKIDGKKLKENTLYKLKNGKFIKG